MNLDSSMSPLEMFLFSIKTGRRLPEGIHETMLLWSFDEKQADIVKDYLKWVKNCEERENYRENFKLKMKKMHALQNVISFFFGSFTTLVVYLFFYIIK